jgi:uncharacterized SAM-binding protein YcdF (DUF218 family)
MFFVVSKVLWFIATPNNLLLIVALAGLILATGTRARRGRRIALVAVVLLIAIGLTPVGAWLIEPLEDRFPPPPSDIAAPHGIIVLGGAIDNEMGLARGQVSLVDGAERLTEAVSLARRFPNALVVYAGGDDSLTATRTTEAADAGKLLAAMGVDPARLVLEDRSRNTDENARFTGDIVHPEPNQVWLLVTSAWHMPRSMGLFRKAGFNVVAYPVDYRSRGDGTDWRHTEESTRRIRSFNLAVHEWIGLIAYRLSGRTDDLFPAP